MKVDGEESGGSSSSLPRNDSEAMVKLAERVRPSDPDVARQWLERAAEMGNVIAMFNLGMMSAREDPVDGRRWYGRAAQLGHTRAMVNLACMMRDTDPAAARLLYEKAAKRGNAEAMYQLGNELGRRHPRQARRWYRRAAEGGDAAAMNRVGLILARRYMVGPGGAECRDEALAWFARSADLGYAPAAANLSLFSGDDQSKLTWLRKAVVSGNSTVFLVGAPGGDDRGGHREASTTGWRDPEQIVAIATVMVPALISALQARRRKRPS